MRIVAFSDFRVQDVQKTVEFAAEMNPDVILYAGDDIDRLGQLGRSAMARLLKHNRREETGIRQCMSSYHDTWRNTENGWIKSTGTHSLYDMVYFSLRISNPVTESRVMDVLAKTSQGTDFRASGMGHVLQVAKKMDMSVSSLLKKAEIYFERTPSGAEGIVSIAEHREDHIQRLAAASRHGFCGVIGNDDSPVYKMLLEGNGVFDVHDRPVSVGRFTIIGQEGASISDGRGFGSCTYSEEEIERHLDASLRSKKDQQPLILVSHTPPYGILDHAVRFTHDHIGSPAVRNFIAKHKPLLVVCGHVHSHGGCETKVDQTTIINVASHDGENDPGRICVIDISDELEISTQWFLVTPEGALEYSSRYLEEGGVLDSALNIRYVGYKAVQMLELNDIRTVKDVKTAGEQKLVQCGIGRTAAKKMAMRAELLLERKAAQIAPMQIPEKPLMFVDIETDLNQAYTWLISAFVEDDESSFRQFYAETPAGEKNILHDFLAYYKKFGGPIICYYSGSEFDERVIKNRISAHGLDGSMLGDWFDLYPTIERSIILPIKSMSLKSVADYFGYGYKHLGMNGIDAALMYTTSIGKREKEITKKLLEYGKDDIMSLHHIISNMNRVAGIMPDRSWQSPEETLPVSFEEQCSRIRSLKDQGLTRSDIANRFGKSANYVKTRLRQDPKSARGKKIAFVESYARFATVLIQGSQTSEHGSHPSRKNQTICGEILEQVSENVFRVKFSGKTFEVNKKYIKLE